MAKIRDGLVNLVTGLGMIGQSKSASAEYAPAVYNSEQYRNAFRTSWLARSCVEMPVDDAMAGGRNWQATPEQITALEAEERRLKWKQTVKRAKQMARLYGGAGILIDDGTDTTQPLDLNRVRRGGIRKILALARDELGYHDIDRDIASEGYGAPTMWHVTSLQRLIDVHPSRVVMMQGDDPLDGMMGQGEIWCDPVLMTRLEAIKKAESAIANAADLIYEANIDVFKIPGLTEKLRQGHENSILKRMQLAQIGKSNSRGLITDAEEGYERKAVTFGSLPELLRELLQAAAGASQIPATRLLGRSPAGMNSTGEGDEQVYFGRLKDLRSDIQAETSILDECLIRSALGGRPAEIFYVWPALREMSEKDKADIADKTATAWEKIERTGAFDPAIIRAGLSNALIEAGVAPGLEAAMIENPDMPNTADTPNPEGDDDFD